MLQLLLPRTACKLLISHCEISCVEHSKKIKKIPSVENYGIEERRKDFSQDHSLYDI